MAEVKQDVARIEIQYCGGWGYGPYAESLKQKLESEFGSQVVVVKKRDPGVTGNFEVTILNNGQLIHSKKTRGQKKCEKSEEVKAVFDHIRAFLSSSKSTDG